MTEMGHSCRLSPGDFRSSQQSDVANTKLAGSELQLFVDKKEIRHSRGDLGKLSDLELVQRLARMTQLLLEDHSGDGDGNPGA